MDAVVKGSHRRAGWRGSGPDPCSRGGSPHARRW